MFVCVGSCSSSHRSVFVTVLLSSRSAVLMTFASASLASTSSACWIESCRSATISSCTVLGSGSSATL